MLFNMFKRLLPGHSIGMRVLRGPFSGARVVMNPRQSLRKVLGLYEHELNAWLERALTSVSRVIDVGANDGYFTFGCAAAFRRLRRQGSIFAIEVQNQHMDELRAGSENNTDSAVRFDFIQAFAGSRLTPGYVTLDSIAPGEARTETLIKIDVEGAEMEVIAGGLTWINRSNWFVIEVHQESYLAEISRIFAKYDHKLTRIDQRPLPLLGRETRPLQNWWLVSDIRDKERA